MGDASERYNVTEVKNNVTGSLLATELAPIRFIPKPANAIEHATITFSTSLILNPFVMRPSPLSGIISPVKTAHRSAGNSALASSGSRLPGVSRKSPIGPDSGLREVYKLARAAHHSERIAPPFQPLPVILSSVLIDRHFWPIRTPAETEWPTATVHSKFQFFDDGHFVPFVLRDFPGLESSHTPGPASRRGSRKNF